jgi:Ca2+/Na+ antiporter
MSCTTEHRGFAVGQEVGSCGRCARLVSGLLGLVYIGTSVARMGPSAALTGHIAGDLLLTVVLYIVLFWALGEGVLLYWSLACLLAALMAYGDCEVVALPSLLFRRHYTAYCPLNVIDLVERRGTKR